MTSWKNKLAAAAATGVVVAGLFPAMALGVGASVLDSTATTADPEGPGYMLVVTGLEDGDKVNYYQIIEQDLDTTDDEGNTVVGTQAWKLSASVDADGDGIVDGTENTDFGHKDADGNPVKGLWVDEMVIAESDTTVEEDVVTSDTRQLTPAMVNALSAAVTNNEPDTAGSEMTAADGKVTVSDAAGGMYMFVAVPGGSNPDNYLYKPIFVSADYYNTISTPEDNTHAIDIEEGVTDYPKTSGSTDDAGVFKRSPLTIDKKSGGLDDDGDVETDASGNYDTKQDVAVGDTVEFSIKVPMVTYTKNYVAPQFYITDTLTKGLQLQPGTITVVVKDGDSVVTTAADKDYKIYTKTSKGTSFTGGTEAEYKAFKGKDTELATSDGFVVQFLGDDPTVDGTMDGILYKPATAPTVTITYEALVTTEDGATFAQQVNQMDNTAKLEYSNDPNFIPDGYFTTDDEGNKTPDPNFEQDKPNHEDENGNTEETGELQDKTRHYTFDIDADVLGRDQSSDVDSSGNPLDESEHDKTSEIRKIWVDANGEIIQSKTTSDVVKDGTEEDGKDGEDGEYGWLEGAEFTLTKIADHVTMGVGIDKFVDIATANQTQLKFDADTHILDAEGSNPTSDAKGYIAMKGLDAGKYVLKEIKAPLGYAFNPNIQYEITITPTYVMEPATPDEGTTPEDGKGGADDLILSSYEIKIVTQKLDSQMNIIDSEKVETISTYNIKQTDGVPDSMLKEDGSQNTSTTMKVTVQNDGSNTTAMIMNKKLGILPATGGSGIIFYLGVGGAIAAIAVVLMRKVKKSAQQAAANRVA